MLLEIDHIQAVAQGGLNDLVNLITACKDCNAGKRDKALDDQTAMAKRRAQLEELQERREQLEMMMAWQEGLRDLKEEVVNRLCSRWYELAPGWVVNDTGRQRVKSWLRKFSVEQIGEAMEVAAEQYLRFTSKDTCTRESWGEAFSKIPGICRVHKLKESDPDLAELYYIRGILRNRCNYFDDGRAMQWLKAARSWGVEIDELREIATSVRNWTQFSEEIDNAIATRKRLLRRGS